MAETKWTPGPWEWWTSNSWRRLSSRARGYERDGGVLCPITQQDGHPDILCSDENKALISAAPDFAEAAALQDAAEEAHANCPECDGKIVPELCEACFTLFDDARTKRWAALAKARGETA